MKTKIYLSVVLSVYFCSLTAQVPQGFTYQAVARNSAGNPITNSTVKVKLSVLTDTAGFYFSGTGTYVWEEEHTNVKTNAYGLITLIFGDPLSPKVQGSAASFSAINWNVPQMFIGVKIASPTDYKNMGTTKLLSVPYSLLAKEVGSISKLKVKGTETSMDSALFEVRNKTGQIVFAVYNEGVRIYVDNGLAKGSTKGGFAIGGFN